jgi:hypothetical protein
LQKYTQKIKEDALMEKELNDLKVQVAKLMADMKTISDENTSLKATLAEKEKFATEAGKKARETEVKAFIESLKKEGKVLPAQETVVMKQLMEADASKKEKFSVDGKEVELTAFESVKNYYSSMPNLIKFQEKAMSEETGEVKAEFTQGLPSTQKEDEKAAQLNAEAKAIMKADSKIGYKDALKKASLKHPELV